MYRRRRRIELPQPEITLTALIDTAFTLLIIFMVTTPLMQNSLKISLPETKNSSKASLAADNVLISVDKNKLFFVNDHKVTEANLAQAVTKALAKSKDKIVIVQGDKDVVYKDIIRVVDLINGVPGIKHVALAAKRSA
jgi:biopolymer transport protein ExbD